MSVETLELQEVDKLSPITKVESEIARMSKDFSGLTIKDVNDREGFQKVTSARKEVKAIRIEVEKERKKLVEDSVKWQRQVNEAAKGITNRLIAIEEPLQQMEDAHQEEKERIKAEAERLRKEKIQKRAQVLTSFSGVLYNGFTYSIGSAVLSQTEIESLSDDDFQSKVEIFEAEYQVALSAKLEAERVAKEEADRLEAQRKEQEAQAAELKRQQEEMLAREAELKRKQDEAEAELRRQKEAVERQEREVRHQQELEEAKKVASEQARQAAELKAKQDAEAKIEADRKEAEKEAKRLELLPDKEKFNQMVKNVFNAIDGYTFTTQEGIEAYSEFEHGVSQLVSQIGFLK